MGSGEKEDTETNPASASHPSSLILHLSSFIPHPFAAARLIAAIRLRSAG